MTNTLQNLTLKDFRRQRRVILTIFFALTLFGLLMIYESSSLHAFKTTSDAAYFFKKQAVFFLIGLSLFCYTLFWDLEFLKRYNKEFLIFTILLLLAVLIFGRKGGGAKRWFSIFGFSFQPSELLKISFLLYCADFYQRKKGLLRSITLGLFPLGVVLGIICFLLLLQPDLGTAVFWVAWMILFLYLFGARQKHLITVMLLGLVAAIILIRMYPYRLSRIISYINPFSDPKGAGFQLIQSQIAYGIGGIKGAGFGEGLQKLSFLPAAHTDFVFSIVAEEFGLFGSLGLLSVFFIAFHKMFRIANCSFDKFRKAILWGVIFIFFLEVVINIGVSCGLLPTKGLPLPFISYGGSSLVVHYILLGLFFNASRPAGRQDAGRQDLLEQGDLDEDSSGM